MIPRLSQPLMWESPSATARKLPGRSRILPVAADDLRQLVVLRRLSRNMMRRIGRNYKAILGINGTLIVFGVAGVIQPTTSAFLHNASTLALSLRSMNYSLDS